MSDKWYWHEFMLFNDSHVVEVISVTADGRTAQIVEGPWFWRTSRWVSTSLLREIIDLKKPPANYSKASDSGGGP